MAEVERVKKADSAARAFQAIRQRLDSLVREDIIPPINSIDKGEWDGQVCKDGHWMERE
jgi:hypothetical protein